MSNSQKELDLPKATEAVKDALFNTLGEVPLAVALGVLEVTKIELLAESTVDP